MNVAIKQTYDGRITEGHLKRIGRGRGNSEAELEYLKRYLRLMWSLWTVLKSLLAMSIQLAFMELYRAAHPTPRILFTFGVNMGSIYLIRGGVPVKSKRCGIGGLRCGGRQNVRNGFLRMDPEGDMS